MEYRKRIGIGHTAAVYEWDDGKVLKLFYRGYPKEAAEKEFHNAMAVKNMNFAKPNVYELITCNERLGIIYDRVQGESLLDWVLKTGDVQKCAVYMANLHKVLIQNKIYDVPDYKDFLKYFIQNAAYYEKREDILQRIDALPDGNTLCHGDFHPGNILIADGNTAVIDFMNVCHGDFLYDVARTVFLVQYTPVPSQADDKEMLLQFKKTLADSYLKQMNVTRDTIQDYLSVIAAVRKLECPNEQ